MADLTFVASVNPIAYVGARPILVDAEAATYNQDPALIVAELDRRATAGARQPAAIELVHLVGHPAPIDEVVAAADRHGIPVIEDASEALGARYTEGPHAGRHVGTIGRLGAFSFNGNKLITTGGGGMIVTDDEALARRARHLSTQARLPGLAYDHDEVGYNYRLSNIAAAARSGAARGARPAAHGPAGHRGTLRRGHRRHRRDPRRPASELGGSVLLAVHGCAGGARSGPARSGHRRARSGRHRGAADLAADPRDPALLGRGAPRR